jgi:hypothetical protein
MAQGKHISADSDGDALRAIKDMGAAAKQWPDAGSLA